MSLFKKITLSLGTIGITAAPISAAISCGSNNHVNNSDKETKKTQQNTLHNWTSKKQKKLLI